jgi:hypothetical protein
MKRQLLSIALGLLISMTATSTFADPSSSSKAKPTPEEKALKSFNSKLDNPVNTTVLPAIGGYIFESTVGDHRVTAAYNSKGKWTYTITYYATDNLDKYVMEHVRDNYEDYYIAGMDKIEQPGNGTVFLVYISNHDSFKTVEVIGSDVVLVKDIHKA